MRKIYFLFIVLSYATVSTAQSITNYSFTPSDGTFTPLTGGTPVATSTSVADFLGDFRTSTSIPLGFTFYYMGNTYTSVIAASDGFLTLHPTGTSITANNLSTGSSRPILAALWDDLDGASGSGSASYLTEGAAGARVFTLEWLNWQWNYLASGATISFQIKLYEATGAVEFIYRPETGAVNSGSASVGITAIGTGAGNFLSLNGLTAAATVSSTVETNNINAKPAAGQTYTFTPLYNTTPSTPTALTFSNLTATTADVTWTDDSNNETFFNVYRSTDNVTFTLVATIPSTTTAGTGTTYTYSPTGLSVSTQYYWRVASGNEASAASAPVSGSMTTTAGTLSGIKTVGTGGDYPNLTTAFADIRTNGLAGNITLQLITGYPASPETYPILSSNNVVGAFTVLVYPTVAGLSITSSNTTGTLLLDNATNITFDGRVNAIGSSKDLVIENTSTSGYAIRFVNDAVLNTVRYSIIRGVNSSTTNGVITFGSTTGTTGNDGNTIDNSDIRDGATTPTNLIYASGSSVNTNDNNTVSNSNLFNFFSAGSASNGILLSTGSNAWIITSNHFYQTANRTTTASNQHTGINISNSSGNNFTVSNNYIGGSTTSTGGAAWTFTNTTFTNRFVGIAISAGSAMASNVTGNFIRNILANTNSSASTSNGNFSAIWGSAGAVNITGNTIGSQTATSITVNLATNSGGAANLIAYSGSGAVTITNNNIGGISATSATTTVGQSINSIYVSGGTPVITNNIIGGTIVNSIASSVVVTGTAVQAVTGITVTSGVSAVTIISGNTVRNLRQAGTTTSTSSFVRGISYAGSGKATITNNTITALSAANGNTGTASAGAGVNGILYSGSSLNGGTVAKNVISNLVNTNTGAVQTHVVGIGIANITGGFVDGNRIYDLRNASTMTTATTPPTASGILYRNGTTTGPQISNNMISLGDAQTTNTEFNGVWNNATSVGFNIYNNSIVIGGTATSGALNSFGVLRGDNSGTAITTPINIKNNILINNRGGGTGKHYAIANQSTAVNASGFTSNYNVLNTANANTVGLWGAADMTFANWQTTTSQDLQSYSGIPVTFTNIATADLHITLAGATPIESGGIAGLNVPLDYDDQTRAGYAGYAGSGTAPDIGADEFNGVQASPTISNLVITPNTLQCAATPRAVSVTVTAGSSAVTSVTLNYSFNGTAQPAIAMTNSGGTWSGTIPAATPADATVTYYIVATDANGFNSTLVGTSYVDAPYTGATITAATSASTICVGGSVNLTSELNRSTTVTSGAGSTTSNSAGNSPFYHGWGGVKTQYIFTQAELSALGLNAGNITNLSVDISTLGTAVLNGFSISLGHTSQSAFASNNAITPVTQVYAGPGAGNAQTLVAGINTFTFNTPFNWDGTSNIVVQFCYSNNNTGGTSSTVRVDPQPVVTTFYVYADNQPVSTICSALTTIPASGSSGTTSTRPKMMFTGNTAPVSTFSWSDGTGTVGTSQNITVSPATTTTYTVTAKDANNCEITSAPVTVTVLAVPAAPTGTNSVQCGTGVPTASVSGTGTMMWYDAATGGTLLQTGGNTFTGSISATTTFYVAANNGTCDGPRTAVTASVNPPDVIVASRNTNNICPNASVQLTATNTGTTNTYAYTWTADPVAGSGIPTSVTGSPVTITPTAAGTYTYTVTGFESATGCATTATVTVTVIEPPVINPITATLETICSGSSTTLTATTPVVGPGTATVGTGTITNAANTTTATAYPAPFGNYYWGAKNQMLIHASELIAAGLKAGNITSLAFDVVTPETEPLIDFTIKVKHSALATLAAMETTGFTTVFTDPAYVPSSSPGYAANTITFTTPFAWDGVSNIIIETCFNNSDFVLNAVFNQSATSYVSTRVYRVDATGVCASGSTTFSYSQRPNMQIGGIATVNGASNFTWVWNPGALTGNVVTVSPTTTTTYTVTATDPATGCSNTASKTITVTPVTATASSNAGGTVCQGTPVQLTATPSGGAPFTYSWSNGTAVVGTTQTVTVSPTATTTYTVTVTDACGNTTTAQVIVTVNNPAVTSTIPGTRCGIGTVTLQATGEAGATLNWYTAATGGSPIATGTSFTTPSLNATTTYYVAAVNGGSNRFTGRLAPQAGAGTNLTTYGQDFTITSATTLNSVDVISTTGTSITISLYSANGASQLQTTGPNAVVAGSTTTIPLGWALAPGTYRLVANGMTGDFIRENSTVTYPISLGGAGQINGFVSSITGSVTTSASYYFMYNWNMFIPCEGTRTAVTATVTTPPDFNITGSAAICSGQSATLTAASTNTGYTYSWMPGSLSGSSVTVSPTATTEYFVTATDASGGANDGCVTIDSFTVTVNPLPSAPVISGTTTICNGQSTQLTAESVYGIPTIRITELTAFRTGTGQTNPYPSNVGTGDDLIEISNLYSQPIDVSGMVVEVWMTTTLNRTWTAPAGTVIPGDGVLVLHIGSGTDNAGNLFFNMGGSNPLSSSSAAGVLIKYQGDIMDALAVNSYAWPAASGVTAADWSGNIASSSGFAGVSRTAPTDNNVASDWTISSAAAPQTVGTANPGLSPITPPSLSYAWTPATGLSSTTIANPMASPTSTQTYTVTVTESVTGCTNSNNVTVTVNELPAITTHPRDTIFCPGGNATFTVVATGTALTYQWKKNGVDISGATTSTLMVNNASTADAGTYTVVVSGACAPAVTSTGAVLSLYVQPTINTQPVAQTACVGTSTTFSVGATGQGITYQWRKDGIDIGGATSASYTISSVVMGDAGNYDVVISGTCTPSVTSVAVALTVNPAPAITSQPAGMTLCAGNPASFSVTATGPGLTYQWKKNGVDIAGATASTFNIAAAAVSDAGDYTVVVSGSCAPSVTSAVAALVVNTAPAITTQPLTQTICAGQNVTFNVVATGTALTYQWKKNGTDIGGATSASFTITGATAADAADYTVVVSGTCTPPVTSNIATLTVDQAPVIGTQPVSQAVCEGANVTFSVAATGVGLTYQWYRNGTVAITGATANSYTITAATPSNAGQYHVVVNSSCGTSVTSNPATLTVNTPPVITQQPASQTACLASNVTFSVSATGTSLTYQWKKNGTDITGATSSTLTINNVSAADLGGYSVVVTGICGTPVTSAVANLAVSATNTWLGIANSDWNNASNWCAGVPTSTSVILIPSSTPFSAILLGNGSVKDLTVQTGATLTVGAGGNLSVYGNITNSGTITANLGAMTFAGTANQSIPALTVGHVIINGSGITLGGTMTIGSSLTLTAGHITLGSNNLILPGGTLGSVASHIITNGTGVVTSNNVGVASVIFPIGPDASSYNPVMIANGGGRNYSAGVSTGINPAIFNPARAINRTWNVTVNTAPAAPATITFGYADAHANASAVPTANMEVGRHSGTAWTVITPAGGVAPFGVATLRTVTSSTAAFGPFVVSNVGGILNPTSLPDIDADVTSAELLPNAFESSTILRVNVRRSMTINWTIYDATGKAVMTFRRNVFAGQTDIPLMLRHLANGTYYMTGSTDKGSTGVLRFIRL